MQIYDINGIKIHVLGSGKPLVLIHGWGVDSSIWQNFSQKLSSRYKLYLIDLPGFGKSAYIPQDFWIKNIISFLPEKFSIIAWSLGGLYTLKLLEKYSDKIEKIILLNSSPCFIEDTNWPGLSLLEFKAFSRAFDKNPVAFLQNFVHAHIDINLNIKTLPGLEIALKNSLKDLYTLDLRDVLKTIKRNIPIHWILGQEDKIIPCKISDILSLYPNCYTYIYKDCAHSTFLTAEKKLLSFVKNNI